MNGDHETGDAVAAIAALDEPNRRALYDLVASSGEPVGRDAAAASLEISRELAAFHLDQLAAAGLLDVTYRRRSGRTGPGAGRPAKLYRRSDRRVAVSLPPRRFEEAATVLAEGLDRLADPLAGRVVAEVARERGSVLGREVKRAAGPRAGRQRRRAAFMSALRRAGFEPAEDGRRRSVTLANCPYQEIAAAHRELTCGMNLAWAEGLVAALDPGLEATLAPEPGRCCVVFETPVTGDRSDRGASSSG
jgi:predicted ArsR family transcriptional regulator